MTGVLGGLLAEWNDAEDSDGAMGVVWSFTRDGAEYEISVIPGGSWNGAGGVCVSESLSLRLAALKVEMVS